MAGGSGDAGLREVVFSDFDSAALFGAAFGDEGGGADEPLEAGIFFQDNGAGAEYLAEHVAMESGGMGMNGLHELHAYGFLDAEGAAVDGAGDASAGADDEIAGAIGVAVESAKKGEVVAAYGGIAYGCIFADGDVSARLDAAVPDFIDVVIDQADIFAALRALAGLGFGDGVEGMAAAEAGDIAWWAAACEQALEQGFGGEGRFGEAQILSGSCFGRGSGVVGRFLDRALENASFAAGAGDTLAIADLVVVQADAALRRDHERRFRLSVTAFGACHLNAMALWLIGHAGAWVAWDSL